MKEQSNKTRLLLPAGATRRAVVIGAFVLLFWIASFAGAQAAARTWALRYEMLGQGVGIRQIGNSLVTCGSSNLGNGLSCSNTQNGGGTSWYNDQYNMVMSNSDSDPNTVNSSTADLTVPVGSTILRAQLYWGGSFNPNNIGDQANANKMKFKKSTDGSYQDITADVYDSNDITSSSRIGRSYGATKDITNLFTSNGWGSGTYVGADVKATTGCTSGYDNVNGNNTVCNGTQSDGGGSLGNYAGWALLVVFQDLNDQTIRYVGINDGFTCVVSGGQGCPASLNVNFSGFNIPAGGLTGQRWGLLAWDGDTGNGDGFSLNGVQQSDGAHPLTNYFNSRISLNGSNVTTRSNSSRVNNLGMDLVESNSGNFTGGTTSIPGTFTTGQTSELVLQHFFWLEVETTDKDYGDDPVSYGDVSHSIALSSSTLYLGNVKPDPETGMQNTGGDATTAQGDNTHGTNDEEGVTFPGFYSNQTGYAVTVKVNNTFGQTATLYGWIDLDRDGIFEANEFASATVTNGMVGDMNLVWNGFPTIPVDTLLYSRFRLTTNTLTDNGGTGVDERSIGSATDGEVEDYRITVTAPTAVGLSAFDANAKNKRVDLKWSTGSELNVVGFNVWRTGRAKGTFEKINLELIPAKQAGGLAGADYVFKDKNRKPGKRYFYKLEMIGTNGSSEWSDVIIIKMPGQKAK
ncbi:MAG: hypothetical protein IT331_17410 [Anaerolineae bacterium]|nr:hypothetical protein [Anaerolineae bacterium]